MAVLGVEIVGAIGRRPGRRVWQITGVSTDSRSVRPGHLFFALPGERVDGHDFVLPALDAGAGAAVVSRDVAVPSYFQDRLVRVPDTLKALGDSAQLHRRRWGGMIIAITGSNGKTTTREMLYHVLSGKIYCKRSPRSFNTDVGVPLTLFQAERTDRALIVEMGTNAPGEIAALAAIAEPNMAIITNIAETHLEGLGSVEGVAREKGALLDALGTQGIAFLNADDGWFSTLARRHPGKVISFGLSATAAYSAWDLTPGKAGYAFTIPGGTRVRLRVPGRHNVLNALVVLAVAQHLGLNLRDAAARLETFLPPEMRYQVEHIRGVTVVSDCYNANPASVRAALRTLKETVPEGRRVAVIGDMMELGDQAERLHRGLGAEVVHAGLDALWTVGEHSESVGHSAREGGMPGRVSHGRELDRVADEVCDFLKPGDVVLVKGSRGMQMERLVARLRSTT